MSRLNAFIYVDWRLVAGCQTTLVVIMYLLNILSLYRRNAYLYPMWDNSLLLHLLTFSFWKLYLRKAGSYYQNKWKIRVFYSETLKQDRKSSICIGICVHRMYQRLSLRKRTALSQHSYMKMILAVKLSIFLRMSSTKTSAHSELAARRYIDYIVDRRLERN